MAAKHSKVVGVRYSTTDYGIFKPSIHNRKIRLDRVKSLAKSMKEKGFYPYAPIVVTPTMTIIEGHHRWQAAISAKVPIHYFIDDSPGTDAEKIMRVNEDRYNWQKFDSVDGLVKTGNKSYIVFDQFEKDFPEFKPTERMMMLQNRAGDVNKTKFSRGLWEHKDEKLARVWAKNLMKLKPFFKQGYNKSIFVRAMIDVFVKHPEFNFDDFLHKVQLRPGSIHLCGTKDHYKGMIEDIYNYRRNIAEKINLRF